MSTIISMAPAFHYVIIWALTVRIIYTGTRPDDNAIWKHCGFEIWTAYRTFLTDSFIHVLDMTFANVLDALGCVNGRGRKVVEHDEYFTGQR